MIQLNLIKTHIVKYGDIVYEKNIDVRKVVITRTWKDKP